MVSVLLEFFVWSSHESRTCNFMGFCGSVYLVSELFTIFIFESKHGVERKYQKLSSEFSSLTLEKKV